MSDFERIFSEQYQTVRKFLLRLSGDEHLSDELTQETFYLAMKQWKDFRGQCQLSTWLCGIAKRQYFQWQRKPPPTPVEDVPEGADFTDPLLDKEQRITIHRLLHSLPEPYREVVTLRTFGELTREEIGSLFGKSGGWARTIYYRGRQQLNHLWKEENPE